MIRVNNTYLDLFPDTDVYIERQAKLFGELDTTKYDFSYDFEFPYTTKNIEALGFPLADVASKTVYTDVSCDIVGADGIPIYSGQLRVESINKGKITASFFSGNYNWLSMLTGDLSEIDFSEFDTDQEYVAISTAWANEDGITFPLIDNGALITRSYKDLKLEDFQGALYVKSIFKKIFYGEGIKFQGELINDWVFNKLIVCRNNKNKDQVNARSCYANKTAPQAQMLTTVVKVTFTDDSTFPFFDGEGNNYSTVNSRYTADADMLVKVECSLILTRGGSEIANFFIYKNGVQFEIIHPSGFKIIRLASGDYIELFLDLTVIAGGITIETDSSIKITPAYIYKAFGNALVPKWTKQEFVTNILNLFNVISDYDPVSKTVTFNLFEKLKTKTPIDISSYIDPETIEIDFQEVVSSYGKNNYLSYQESDDEDLREYNVSEFLKYGSGVIAVDNSFIQESSDVIDSDFKTPISYKNSVFDASLERTNFVSLEEGEVANITGVTDSAGAARFAIDDDLFSIIELVRISESSNEAYNGDWVVNAQGAGYIECSGLFFSTNATGVVTKLSFTYNNSDDTFLFVNMPAYNLDNYSSIDTIRLESNSDTSPAYAYFNLLNTSRPANDILKQSLSFGEVNDPLFYQKTLTETYWRSVGNVLNDPVMIRAQFYFPNSVFRSLTPLSPVHLKTQQTVNLYYVNRISGYVSSDQPCEVELIKL